MTSLDSGHASPYATGGGGTVLEHAYGATLLAALLQRLPVSSLGDEFTPREVRFQQSALCPVDDLVVVGDCPTGTRTMFVGVRRDPTIGASSSSFVSLLADYLQVVIDHRVELDADRERLALAVAAPHTAAGEVKQLAYLARRQRDDPAFRAAVGAPKATNGKVRARLRNLDEVVTAAAVRGVIRLASDTDRSDLTWRLLRTLRIIELRLEGDDPADRTLVVSQLVPLVGSAARAVDLWRSLTELSSGYAQARCHEMRRTSRAVMRVPLITPSR